MSLQLPRKGRQRDRPVEMLETGGRNTIRDRLL